LSAWGNSLLGTDVLNYGGKGDYKFAGVLSAEGNYDYKRNMINAVRDEIKEINSKVSFKKSGVPYADYTYYNSQEKNCDAYPDNIDQQIARHTGSLGYNFTFFKPFC